MTANMMIRFAAALFVAMVFGQTVARAQNAGAIDWQVRGFYSVAGLKPGDTLNVRDRSSARSEVLGELGPGTVVFATGQTHRRDGQPWYQINHREGLAWVNAAFLTKQRVVTISDTWAPIAGSCGGFEPGWEASWDADGLRLQIMSGPIGSARFSRVISPQGAPTPSVIEFTNRGQDMRMTLVLQNQQCEALPVDRDSYQTGLLLVEVGGSLSAYSGCCNPAAGAITSAN